MLDNLIRIEGLGRNIAEHHDDTTAPLPPAPNYGPFGYFRLALLVLAVFVAILMVLQFA